MKKDPQKNQIQVGITINFKRDEKGRIIPGSETNVPIYEEMTPELQKRYDETINNFAKALTYQIIEYQRNGGDLSKLGTPEGDEEYNKYRQKQQEERTRKKELARLKRKMTEKDLEEFLQWKENKDKKTT